MGEYERPNLVYEKEDLLISADPQMSRYSFWRVAKGAIGGKDKGDDARTPAPLRNHAGKLPLIGPIPTDARRRREKQ